MALAFKDAKAVLPNGYIAFDIFQKDDYWLVNVSAGETVIWPDDLKQPDYATAELRAETMYAEQRIGLLILDRLGPP